MKNYTIKLKKNIGGIVPEEISYISLYTPKKKIRGLKFLILDINQVFALKDYLY